MALKCAKNAFKLCTVDGLPRNWKFESIFANPSRGVTDPFKIQNKQRAILQIFSDREETLSGGLKRAKNASKLCTVFGKRRSEKFWGDFWSDFGGPA